MNILFGYFAFVFCFFLVGTIILFVIEKLLVLTFQALKEFFYPTPTLSEEEAEKIYKEAAEFVHSKHRPWAYDDTFAEYLALVHEMSMKRWDELYGSNQ
ncbi:MAG: hypothetical protein VW946_03790 [Gammaproteobacteria bacterium]